VVRVRDAHVLLPSRLIAAAEGHFYEQAELWSEGGRLLVAAHLLGRNVAAT
jgi:hypothetical protein